MTSSNDGAGRVEHGLEGADRVDELLAVVAAQAALIESMGERLERLEARDRAGRVEQPVGALGTDATTGVAVGTRPRLLQVPTSRRQLMTKGAAVAAGAAVAGTALNVVTAAPAAAATTSFFGNPAVLAAAAPATGIGLVATTTSGLAIQGITETGTGMLGLANGTSGDNSGVSGQSQSTDGVGVKGHAAATTGICMGVYGVSVSESGGGIWGEAPALTGPTRGSTGIVQSPTGIGAIGQNNSTSGPAKGVMGQALSPDGFGVYGLNSDTSNRGIGVFGAGGIGVQALSGRSQMKLAGGPPPPLSTTSLARTTGELVFDFNGDMWICVVAGTPGTWRRLGGPTTTGALTVLPATKRIYDSRAGTNPTGVTKGIFGNHEERAIDATLGTGIPKGATAVLLNATATNTNPGGFFAFFKNGIAWPSNSSLSWGLPNSTIANLAVVAVDAAATFKARCEGPGGADLIVDCVGYYQ